MRGEGAGLLDFDDRGRARHDARRTACGCDVQLTDQACAEPGRMRNVVILHRQATEGAPKRMAVPDRLAPRIAAPLPSQDLSTALVPAASPWR